MYGRIRQIRMGFLVVLLVLGSTGWAFAGEPLALVRTSIDKAIRILKNPELQSPENKNERIDRLREVLNPIFDYDEMAKRALEFIGGGELPPSKRRSSRCSEIFSKESIPIRSIFTAGKRLCLGARS